MGGGFRQSPYAVPQEGFLLFASQSVRGMPGGVKLREGHLVKKPLDGHVLSSARRRFFVLRAESLEWFATERSTQPRGRLLLDKALVKRDSSELVLESGGERLVLRGDDLEGWEASLESALNRASQMQEDTSRRTGRMEQVAASEERLSYGEASLHSVVHRASQEREQAPLGMEHDEPVAALEECLSSWREASLQSAVGTASHGGKDMPRCTEGEERMAAPEECLSSGEPLSCP